MFIIANWKMNPESADKALDLFANEVKWLDWLPQNKKHKIIICPPFIWLYPVWQQCQKYLSGNVALGAQNLSDQDRGPHTGEISATMLKDVGCKYVMVGHSERRKLGETDHIINRKIKIALKADLIPILCIGETKYQRKNNQTKNVIKRQLKIDLRNTQFNKTKEIVIAYEPIWAIGKIGQETIGSDEVFKIKEFIKNIVSVILVQKNIKVSVLYGGSVDSKNVNNFIGTKLMDGVLVGTSSLDHKEFIAINKAASS